MNYFWNLAIINYNLEKQFSVARKTHGMLKKLNIKLGYATLVSLAVTTLGVVIITFGYRHLARSREENLVCAFIKKLKHKYPLLEITTATSLQELAETINDPQVRSFADIYCAAIYQDRKLSGSECKALREIVAKL